MQLEQCKSKAQGYDQGWAERSHFMMLSSGKQWTCVRANRETTEKSCKETPGSDGQGPEHGLAALLLSTGQRCVPGCSPCCRFLLCRWQERVLCCRARTHQRNLHSTATSSSSLGEPSSPPSTATCSDQSSRTVFLLALLYT